MAETLSGQKLIQRVFIVLDAVSDICFSTLNHSAPLGFRQVGRHVFITECQRRNLLPKNRGYGKIVIGSQYGLNPNTF